MDEAAIYSRLTDIFQQVLQDDTIVLTPETTAEDVPGWDSMNHVFLVVEVERRFGIKFQTADMEDLKNVGEFAALISRKLTKVA